MMPGAAWTSAARTHPGKVRARNEDAFLDSPGQGLWVVADGMGGHHAGDRASRLVVESLAELPATGDFADRLQHLRRHLHWLNRRLADELTVTDGQRRIMGSTVAALLVEGSRAACVWAGDSRCYLWRWGCLYQLTRDHSLLRELIEDQGMSPEQAGRHPSAHALTRALGGDGDFALEVLELELHPGDTFLLCSDGLYRELDEVALSQALSLASPIATLEQLFDQALQGAAPDNLTAVVARR
ncbi:PP2C family protein-serine/threonine phosphatase [Metapseudomonas otitidis]|uniref:PP2C family protein-serine/threonine phosphatase n=1 Tax=Metapseudomonas otitidis TaxID=319939 RepID=UPI003CEA8A76